jgi:hypothetical protein
MQSSSNTPIIVHVTAGGNVEPCSRATRAIAMKRLSIVDMDAARRYFAGLESLAREAKDASDPRIMDLALKVLALQRAPGGCR